MNGGAWKDGADIWSGGRAEIRGSERTNRSEKNRGAPTTTLERICQSLRNLVAEGRRLKLIYLTTGIRIN
jgi:hypothetical protein